MLAMAQALASDTQAVWEFARNFPTWPSLSVLPSPDLQGTATFSYQLSHTQLLILP